MNIRNKCRISYAKMASYTYLVVLFEQGKNTIAIIMCLRKAL